MKFKIRILFLITNFVLFFSINNTYSFNYDALLQRFIDRNGKIVIGHGFIGSKTIDIFIKLVKLSCKKNKTDNEREARDLYLSGFLWNLAKLKMKFQMPLKNGDLTFGFNSFFYDYDNYFIPVGCMYLYPGPECIFRRIGFAGIHIGYEKYYSNRINTGHVFSYNFSAVVNIIAKKYIPFDLILSFSPFIYQNHYNFYIELNTSFSIGEFIKKILIANVHYSKLYRNNCDINSLPESIEGDREIMEHFKNKNTKLLNGQISKAKFIFVDGLIWSLIYNTRLYIGIKVL
jgi:hypothetical protein